MINRFNYFHFNSRRSRRFVRRLALARSRRTRANHLTSQYRDEKGENCPQQKRKTKQKWNMWNWSAENTISAKYYCESLGNLVFLCGLCCGLRSVPIQSVMSIVKIISVDLVWLARTCCILGNNFSVYSAATLPPHLIKLQNLIKELHDELQSHHQQAPIRRHQTEQAKASQTETRRRRGIR